MYEAHMFSRPGQVRGHTLPKANKEYLYMKDNGFATVEYDAYGYPILYITFKGLWERHKRYLIHMEYQYKETNEATMRLKKAGLI